ncbi:fungal-specific transcription factor domain-containing protein [Aspergillus cavernicola]|uniref:Fungal-specific transcription factor domain-containing protein n=1 Tax=Aspergillus cavernicola TaxID=176166 RepID=A0ABR4IYZ2_9EURO
MSTQDRKELHLSVRSRRAARACTRCHLRKVRCDGSITGFPCTNCRLDGRSCTLHSGKRDSEKQIPRAIAKGLRSDIYPSLPSSELHSTDVNLAFVRSHALRVPIQDVLDVFTKHYFLYVHPCLPVIDEAGFWRKYRCVDGSAGKISTLLFQSMLFAASSFVPLEAAKECGYHSLISARDDLYHRAKRLHESGIEKDRLVTSQASLLLTYYTTDTELATNSRWLRIAIRHAKKERAHLYPRLPQLESGRKSSDLKRLWWCCMIRDRIISLGMRRPIQITPEDFDLHQPGLSLQDLEEESFHSEVYTPDTKLALCRVLASLCHLVVAVTDLIMLVYPTMQNMPLSRADRRAELTRLEETKLALLDWELNWVANPDGKEYYIHSSLTLYTNLCAIYFQSARIALCNRICLLIGYNTYLADETDLSRIESCRADLTIAIKSTADNVKQLILNGVADKLPISAIAYTLLPQILLSIQTQLSTTPEDKQLSEIMLVFFVEVFRCFRSQYYMGLVLAVSWKALELCQSSRTLLPSNHIKQGVGVGELIANSNSNPNSNFLLGNGVGCASDYPSLFQLRLNEYNRLQRYIDEFMSLRRTPGEGVIYPCVAQTQAQTQIPPSAPCVRRIVSPQENHYPAHEYENGDGDENEDENRARLKHAWTEGFLFAYFGEEELESHSHSHSPSLSQSTSWTPGEIRSKAKSESTSTSLPGYEMGVGSASSSAIGKEKELYTPSCREQQPDAIQNMMLDYLPLLGE